MLSGESSCSLAVMDSRGGVPEVSDLVAERGDEQRQTDGHLYIVYVCKTNGDSGVSGSGMIQ